MDANDLIKKRKLPDGLSDDDEDSDDNDDSMNKSINFDSKNKLKEITVGEELKPEDN